jgi:hypothetical protein
MKYINTWFLFNESKFYGVDILPENALKQLEDYIDDKNTKVEVYPDPKVDGTYALRVYREDLTFDLLWYKNGFDEVSSEENEYGFSTWPPISGDLRFF